MNHSCKQGDCQQCGCQIKAEKGTSKQASPSFSLACQCFPKSDVIVDLFDDPFDALENPRYMPAKVSRKELLTTNVILLSLIVPKNQRLLFRPGQYIEITAPNIPARAYSIAHYDMNNGILDFHVRVIESGKFSKWLLGSSVGDLLQLRGPLGRFFLRNNLSTEHTLFVATGTGIAPILCMLNSLNVEQRQFLGEITLLWGNRNFEDNYLKDKIYKTANLANIHYKEIYSAETAAKYYGRVTDWMPKSFLGFQVYAAGNPNMVAELRSKAHECGLMYDRFHADSFSFSSLAKEGA